MSKKIVEMYDGEIDYISDNNGTAIFFSMKFELNHICFTVFVFYSFAKV